MSDLIELNMVDIFLVIVKEGEIIFSINGGEDILYYDCECFYWFDVDYFLLVYCFSGDLISVMRDLR